MTSKLRRAAALVAAALSLGACATAPSPELDCSRRWDDTVLVRIDCRGTPLPSGPGPDAERAPPPPDEPADQTDG